MSDTCNLCSGQVDPLELYTFCPDCMTRTNLDRCLAFAELRDTIARQARTIRRLRALADGYRARAERNGQAALDNCATCLQQGEDDGVRQERGRVVAAIRRIVDTPASPRYIADAIERGEL